jgi:CBS domain-containing protein
MKISDIVKKDFLVFDSQEPLSTAAKKLAQAGVSEAPVVQKKRYISMFSTSDIARVLVKESVFGKPEQADFRLKRNDPLFKHIRHFTATLSPESDIISACLVLLHKNVDVIPVLGKNKSVAGVVLASDLRKTMAQMLSEGGKVPTRGIPEGDEPDKLSSEGKGNTTLDIILHYVQRNGSAKAEEVSKKFGLPMHELEDYALCLEKHGLLRVEYDIFGKMKLHKLE